MNAKITYGRFQDKNVYRIIQQLIRIRHAKGLSQEALNWKVGMGDNMVAKWECGMKTPRLVNLACWAEALDCVVIIQPIDPNEPVVSSAEHAVNDNETETVKKEAA